MEELQNRIAKLEKELQEERCRNAIITREKIKHMSGEVIDSNPYRYLNDKLTSISFCNLFVLLYKIDIG